jgi:hypothetical protein
MKEQSGLWYWTTCNVSPQNAIRSTSKRWQIALTYLNMSFCVSDGRSKIVFLAGPCARLGPGNAGASGAAGEVALAFVMVTWKVRFQTSSASNFVRGVGYLRRDDLLWRPGIVSKPELRCDEIRGRVCRWVVTWGIAGMSFAAG